MEKVFDSSHERPKGGMFTGIKPLDVVIAQYDFNAVKKSGQLRFSAGDIIYVLSKSDSGWWDGILCHSKSSIQRGWFPRSYTKSVKETGMKRKLYSGSVQGSSMVSSMNSRNASRRNSLRMSSPSGNMNLRSASASRRGSLVTAGNLTRKSLSSIPFHDGLDHAASGSSNVFSASPSTSAGSGQFAAVAHLNPEFQTDVQQPKSSMSQSRKPSIGSSLQSSSTTRSHMSHTRSNSSDSSKGRAHIHTHDSHNSDHSCSKHSISSTISYNPQNDASINILGPQEVEMLLNNMSGDDFVPVWTPVLTSSKTLLYYNKELNIYCTCLPLSRNPELNLKSVFAPHENLVDLRPRDLDSDTRSAAETANAEKIYSSGSEKLTDHIKKSAQAKMSSKNNVESQLNDHEPKQDIGVGDLPIPEHSANAVIEDDSVHNRDRPDLKDAQEEQSNDQNDNHRQFLSTDSRYFYSFRSDIKTWTELKNSTIYYLKASHSFFFRQNQPSFYEHFSQASTFVFYHQLACKLSRRELIKKNVIKDVRKILKRLIKALFRINVNASLYFNSSKRILVSSSDLQRYSLDRLTVGNENFFDTSDFSSSTMPNNVEFIDLKNASTSTATSVDADKSFNSDNAANRTSETIQLEPNTSTKTSIPTNTTQTSNMLVDEESGIILSSLFNVVQADFTRFFKLLNNLHALVLHSIASDDSLVQIFPRFIRDSYEGVMWVKEDFQDVQLLSKNSLGSSVNSDLSSSMNPPFLDSLSSPLFSSRQMSNSSTKTINSPIEKLSSASSSSKHPQRSRLRSPEIKKSRLPLNHNTLSLLKEKLDIICKIYKTDKTTIFSSVNNGKLAELSMGTYNGLKESADFLNLVASLDLQFFMNLKRCTSDYSLEREIHEFCESSMTNAVVILLEFYDLKQALYDITIRYVMDTQSLSLRDPFVFCSMRGELSHSCKDSNSMDMFRLMPQEKKESMLYEYLLSQDVEVNGMSFVETPEVLHEAATKYYNIASLVFLVIEQLIIERENIINYAARMMNSEFIEVLLKGEKYDGEEAVPSSAAMSQAATEDQEAQHAPRGTFMPISSTDIKSSHLLPQSFADEIPWYLDSDFEHDLIYSPHGHIKGGTRIALIEHLTNHKSIDAFFNIVMLTTFRSIFTTAEFLRYLFRRFEISPPEGLSYEEYNIWVDTKQKLIRTRVVSIIKTWFTDYWNDCYYEESVDSFEELINVVNLAIIDEIPGSLELKPIVEERLAINEFKIKHPNHNASEGQNINNPSGLKGSSLSRPSTHFRLKKYKLLDFDPVTFAQQLTLDEHILYSAIDQFECLDRIWHKKFGNFGGSENISTFITSSNHLTDFVSYSIVREADIKKRAQLVQFFIQASEQCYNLKNFSSMTAIVSALYSSPIFRLKKTFARLPKNILNSLDKLNTLMDSTKNFFRYRELLKTVKNVPCVPFFGVYLSDLTFTASGNPDFINNNPSIINFSKRLKIVTILSEIMSFQKATYKLKYSDEIKVFLESEMENIPSIEKQYELSLKIEPRVDVSSTFGGAEYNGTSDISKSSGRKTRFGKLRK